MKNRVIIVLVCIISLLVCASLLSPAAMVDETSPEILPAENDIRAVRFLNMLNHNSSYNEDFSSVDRLVDNATIELLDLRDETDEDYIALPFVADYVNNMYGVELGDVTELNPQFPQKDGFIFINPRGFTEYNHEFVALEENEDGTFTVETVVTAEYHDNSSENLSCISLFVPNDSSDFGYNIVYSNIIYDASEI